MVGNEYHSYYLKLYLEMVGYYNERPFNKTEMLNILQNLDKNELAEIYRASSKFQRRLWSLLNDAIDNSTNQSKVDISVTMYSCSEIASILNISRVAVNNWEIKNPVYRGIKQFFTEQSIEDFIRGKQKYEKLWYARKK